MEGHKVLKYIYAALDISLEMHLENMSNIMIMESLYRYLYGFNIFKTSCFLSTMIALNIEGFQS